MLKWSKLTPDIICLWFGAIMLFGTIQLACETVDKMSEIARNNSELMQLLLELVKKDAA